jgi:hypothetical protein
MNHIAEDILERYLVHPETLREGEERFIEEHLATCSICSEIAAFLRAFHEEFASLRYTEHPRVRKLVDDAFPAGNVIALHPFRYTPDMPSHRPEYTTVLAAMTESATTQRFSPVATYASEQEKAVLRILHDNVEDVFKMYLQTDEPRKREFSMVSFPELPAELVTDNAGHVEFKLPPESQPAAWDALHPVLHIPAEIAELTADQIQGGVRTIELQGGTLRSVYHDGALELEIQQTRSERPRFTHALVKDPDKPGTLVYIGSGRGRCQLDPLPQVLVIRLYY